MPKICDENKTRLSALAQLIQKYAECDAITDNAELATLTQYSERAIRKAKAEIECRNSSANGTLVPEIECQNGTLVPRSPRAPTRIENPSGLNNNINNKHTNTEYEDGWHPFNGSTDYVVGVVCGWVHDVELAKSFIKDSLAFAGEDAEIVKAAILQTKQKIDDGKIITNCPRYTTGTIQRMKGDKAQAQAAAQKTTANNSAMLKTDPSFRLEDYLPAPYDPNDPNDRRGELPDEYY